MAQIDLNRSGMVMIVDEAMTLVGTVTDGDVRRAILGGQPLDQHVDTIMSTAPTTTSPQETTEQRTAVMSKRKLRHLPVVENQKVVGLASLDDELLNPPKGLSAVVMAGGMGTRLGDLTRHIPKPLIPVGGKPILERIVEHLHDAGVGNLVITTRHMAEQVEGYFQDGDQWGVQIDYIREHERRGTAGALRELAGTLTEPLLVMNGDLLTDFSVGQMFQFHKEHNAVMTVGLRQYSFQVPYGVAEVEGVRITALSEKPHYEFFVSAGIYILEPQALDHIPEGYYDITELIELLIQQDQAVVSFPIHEQWMDIGRPEDLARANALLNDKQDTTKE